MDTLNDIISGLKWGNLDPIEAHDRILLLFNVVRQSEQLKALEDLKDFAYDNCQPHNSDRLSEIMERL